MSFANDDQALDYVQGQRKKLVESMLGEDGSCPTDNEDRSVMLKALDGIASTASANKRLKTDKDILDIELEAKQLLHETMLLLTAKAINNLETDTSVQRTINIPTNFSSEFVAVEGEADIGISTETFDDFSKRHGLMP